MENVTLDAVDRQIVHALTVDPRASFRTIAEVTGISDQTAARRYRRLAESAGLRVLGVADGAALGWVDWFVRLQAAPGSADTMAEALARRADTKWVHLTSGGTEIICFLEARTAEQRDALFLRGLPGSRRVVQISAYSLLHHYTPGPWRGIRQALSADQIAMLTPGRTRRRRPGPRCPCRFRATSRCWLSWPGTGAPAMRPSRPGSTGTSPPCGGGSRNCARRACCTSRSTSSRRVMGMQVQSLFWLSVEPARLDEAGRTMASHPEVPFVAATTGPTNLVASALFRDPQHLYEYLTGELAGLSGVRSVETAPVIRTLKRTGSVT